MKRGLFSVVSLASSSIKNIQIRLKPQWWCSCSGSDWPSVWPWNFVVQATVWQIKYFACCFFKCTFSYSCHKQISLGCIGRNNVLQTPTVKQTDSWSLRLDKCGQHEWCAVNVWGGSERTWKPVKNTKRAPLTLCARLDSHPVIYPETSESWLDHKQRSLGKASLQGKTR